MKKVQPTKQKAPTNQSAHLPRRPRDGSQTVSGYSEHVGVIEKFRGIV